MLGSADKRTPRATRVSPRLKTGIMLVLIGLGVGAYHFTGLSLSRRGAGLTSTLGISCSGTPAQTHELF